MWHTLCMQHLHPPITLVLNQYAEADQPLHMEWVACNIIEKLSTNKRKSRKHRLGAKKKSNVSCLELFRLQRRMILTKHLFCVNSALHLLPQWEVTQLICLTIYVGTTQQSPAQVLFWKPAVHGILTASDPFSYSSTNYISHPSWPAINCYRCRPTPKGKLDGCNFL